MRNIGLFFCLFFCFFCFGCQEDEVYESTIIINTENGESITALYGTVPTSSFAVVEKKGYTFLYYYIEDNLKEVPITDENGNFTSIWLYRQSTVFCKAKYDINEYKITFDCKENSVSKPKDLEVSFGMELNSNDFEIPQRDGFEFCGWFLDEGFTKQVINELKIIDQQYKFFNEKYFNDDTEKTKLVTLYAKWEDVSCNITINYGVNDVIKTFKCKYNDTITEPLPPIKEGYTFEGWVKTLSEEKFDFNSPITDNISLSAKWEPCSYYIRYDVNGGNSLENVTKEIKYDSKISGLVEPTHKFKIFSHWEYQNNEKVNSNDIFNFTNDITLKAVWKDVNVKINFDTNGSGERISSLDIICGVSHNLPVPIAKHGFIFKGWNYIDSKNGTKVLVCNEFCSNVVIEYYGTSTYTFQAIWDPVEYEIILDANGGDIEVSSIKVPMSGKLENIPIPYHKYMVFDKWLIKNTDKELKNGDIFDIGDNVSLIAIWQKVEVTINFENDDFPSQTATCGESFTLPSPYINGQFISSWSYIVGEKSYVLPFDNLFPKIIVNNSVLNTILLSPIWENEVYTFSFDDGNGNKFSYEYAFGDTVLLPVAETVITGDNAFKVFNGWNYDVEKKFIDEIIIEDLGENGQIINLTADWIDFDSSWFVIEETSTGLKILGMSDTWKNLKSYQKQLIYFGLVNDQNIVEIGSRSLIGISELKTLVFGENVSSIGDYAFLNNANLEKIVFQEKETLISIGNYSFSGCSKLKEIVGDESLITNVGRGAFDMTYWLENNPNDFIILGSVLLKYNGSKDITQNNNSISPIVKMIASGAFEGVNYSISVFVPETVTYIDDFAFAKSNIRRISISKKTILGEDITLDTDIVINYY